MPIIINPQALTAASIDVKIRTALCINLRRTPPPRPFLHLLSEFRYPVTGPEFPLVSVWSMLVGHRRMALAHPGGPAPAPGRLLVDCPSGTGRDSGPACGQSPEFMQLPSGRLTQGWFRSGIGGFTAGLRLLSALDILWVLYRVAACEVKTRIIRNRGQFLNGIYLLSAPA